MRLVISGAINGTLRRHNSYSKHPAAHISLLLLYLTQGQGKLINSIGPDKHKVYEYSC